MKIRNVLGEGYTKVDNETEVKRALIKQALHFLRKRKRFSYFIFIFLNE